MVAQTSNPIPLIAGADEQPKIPTKRHKSENHMPVGKNYC